MHVNSVFMAEPTLQSVFGTNATQNTTTLTISKADLTGLTATSSNTAESLLVAILLKAKESLSEANRDINVDQSIAVDVATTPSYTTRNNAVYSRDTITVELDRAAGNLTIDPDNY